LKEKRSWQPPDARPQPRAFWTRNITSWRGCVKATPVKLVAHACSPTHCSVLLILLLAALSGPWSKLITIDGSTSAGVVMYLGASVPAVPTARSTAV
jgi:hypothetical protein